MAKIEKLYYYIYPKNVKEIAECSSEYWLEEKEKHWKKVIKGLMNLIHLLMKNHLSWQMKFAIELYFYLGELPDLEE